MMRVGQKVATGIYYQGENSFAIKVSTGRKVDGKYEVYTETFHGTKNQAIARREEIKTDIRRGRFAPVASLTFGEYFEQWFSYNTKRTALGSLRASTARLYEKTIRCLFGHLWHKKLKYISKDDILDVYGGLLQKGRSLHYVLSCHTAFRAAWNCAPTLKAIVPDILADIERALPQKEKTEQKTLNAAQGRRLIAETEVQPLRGIIITCLMTLARIGEVLALRWQDVDFAQEVVTFRMRLYRGQFDKLKTYKSTGPRHVVMTRMLAEELKRIRAAQNARILEQGGSIQNGGLYHDQDLVFAQWNGKPLWVEKLRKEFSRHLANLGLPHIKLHGLRHSSATILRSLGVDLKTIQEICGHTRISTTADIYIDFVKELQKDAMEKMEKALGR